MLELQGITKVYPAGSGQVMALRGIDLQFRTSEFVSILGPSGCGKTTTLNIIGGLDHYTGGDLIINGRSTRSYRDRDWDAYRNHSVGFVFQNYHLIPHQSVLQNVELSLSLSGISKAQRRKRATEALVRVGLEDQLKKKPNQLSGGQMQRVAIARAIVNDPDIILADEPTGALDSETSVQVIEILKEISQDRLVIMVTHNPDLADRYSTRIIRMLDGVITDDSHPLTREEAKAAAQEDEKHLHEKVGKLPSMSFATSFGLSIKNLFTKKGRTTLTAFAGSIGIIGIALIYAVSQGTTHYIDLVQEETLSSYPLVLEATHMDTSSLMETFVGQAESEGEHERDAVYQKSAVYHLMNALNSLDETHNDLAAFKEYVEAARADEEDTTGLRDAVSAVQYTYDLDMPIYTQDADGKIILSDTQVLMQEMMEKSLGIDLGSMKDLAGSGMGNLPGMGMSRTLWQELLPGEDGSLISPVVEKQYELVYGAWPAAYDQVVLVLDKDNELDDLTLYAIGCKTEEDLQKVIDAALERTPLEVENRSWTYQDICDTEFRLVLPADRYAYNEEDQLYFDLQDTDAGLSYLYDNGTPLHITGILRPREDALSPMLRGSIGYTSKLTEYAIDAAQDAEALQAQLDSPDIDVLTGLPFYDVQDDMTQQDKAAAFLAHIDALDSAGKAEMYVLLASTPTDEQVEEAVTQMLGAMTREDLENQMLTVLSQQMGLDDASIQAYIGKMSDEEIFGLYAQRAGEQYRLQYAQGVQQQLASMPAEQQAVALDELMKNCTEEQLATYHDTLLVFSDATYDSNLQRLGYVDKETPSSISLFTNTFGNKTVMEDAIAAYNDKVEELEQITYTDYVGILMSSVTTIINAITYVLIAFVAVSLVVSSIMIGVITLISVQERTREIGILRAIGASKRNVSSMFNAETVVIGFAAGALGVVITYLLCIPINLILHQVTGIQNLSAYLPVPVAIALVAISVVLTLFAGIIPSRSAARKDPVVALRTE